MQPCVEPVRHDSLANNACIRPSPSHIHAVGLHDIQIFSFILVGSVAKFSEWIVIVHYWPKIYRFGPKLSYVYLYMLFFDEAGLVCVEKKLVGPVLDGKDIFLWCLILCRYVLVFRNFRD